MDDMPIINGHHFINLRGIYKLLIAFGDHTENAIAAYRGHGQLKTNIVKDRKKWPVLCRATTWPIFDVSEKEMPTTLLGMHADMKIPLSLMSATIIKSWIQLQKGCTQSHLTSKVLGIARDSPNVTKKREGRVITIAKKYRPVYSVRSITKDALVDELAKVYPTMMINNFFPGSIQAELAVPIVAAERSMLRNAYLVEYTSGVMATIVSITDPSDTIDVARACPLSNFDGASGLLSRGGSFDDIAMLSGPIV